MNTRAAIEAIWADRGRFQIAVDTHVPGVVAPGSRRMLTVRLSQAHKGATVFEDDGIHAELSFNQVMHTCVFPWDAVIVVGPYPGDDWEPGLLWAPERVLPLAGELNQTTTVPSPTPAPAPTARPKLTVIPGGKA